MAHDEQELQAYLARIRKTIAEGDALVSQAALRMAETDRMLEKQGLTRQQVMQMRFSESQLEAANAELRRRGLEPFEEWTQGRRDEAPAPGDNPREEDGLRPSAAPGAELEYRQRKFGMMMKPFQI